MEDDVQLKQKPSHLRNSLWGHFPKPLYELSEDGIRIRQLIGKVTTYVLKHLSNSFIEEGFEWLLPVIFSKSTDPP
jgi:hypothetical protein